MKREFKCQYLVGRRQSARVASCASIEGVIRSVMVRLFHREATQVIVAVDGEQVGRFERVGTQIRFYESR